MMLDPTKATEQKKIIEGELEAVGVRINQSRPDLVFKQKTGGTLRSLINNSEPLMSKLCDYFQEVSPSTRQCHVRYGAMLRERN